MFNLLFLQSIPQTSEYPESMFLNVVIFFFLVMVVGLFGWIINELSKLRDHLSNNQQSLFDKLDLNKTEGDKRFEEFRAQIAEHDSFREVITVKLEHISQHLPDYGLVFRKFTEVDDQLLDQKKQFKKYEYQIEEINKKLDKLKKIPDS